MNGQLTLSQATIGILTALPKELAAVRHVFCPNSAAAGRSGNVYYLCEVPCIDGARVVAMTLLPMMGNDCASAQTTHMLADCGNMRDLMMVGISGAIPCPTDGGRHVRLGDIVVSGVPGVHQFDFGKQVGGKEFECRSVSSRPSALLLGAVNRLTAEGNLGRHPWEDHIDAVIRQTARTYIQTAHGSQA